jgi:hypothetical protein
MLYRRYGIAEQSNAPVTKLRITPEYAGKVFERWKLLRKMRGPPIASSIYPLEMVGE